MPIYFQRPENALKRANEFIDVGKKQPALDALYDVIKSKKHRTWQKIHEPIMEKYLTLCVELRKSHTAKEGLYQYKNICQQVNVKSLEDVIRGYLRLADDKTEEARRASEQTVLDVDDLDNVATPESLLLSAVSGEDTQARTDRIMLIPWVKFLWESYRQCLDLLRNNNRVEKLYQDIAQDAFRFCQKYQRKTEFRKLCDNLRNHLGLIQKHQSQTTAIDLNKPESQQLHLDTRLFQLDTAIAMELWQEAYKAVEDIHSLMGLSKKPPKPQMMANYYQKLGLVFWKSGNGLFHACALHRLLQLSREQRKNLTQDEIQRMATRVLLATLAVPILPPRNDIGDMLDMGDTAMENQRKLANLLGLQTPPTRAQLVKDLVKYNMLPFVLPQVKDLYEWLEVEFHPLELCRRVRVIYTEIEESGEEDLKQYVEALQDNTIMRLLKQVSQIYVSIAFSRLADLVPDCKPFHLERVIVDASRNGAVEVRVDHSNQSLVFGAMVSVSQQDAQLSEGPHLQDQPSDQIRNQLSLMSKTLHKAVKIIRPMHMVEEQRNEKQVMIQHFRRTAHKEHERILTRRHIIEERKEKLESITLQRDREEQDNVEKLQRNKREAEEKRLEHEAQERQHKKEQEKMEEIQRSQARERIKMLKQSTVSQKVFKKLNEEELEKLDPDEIMAKHVEQLEVEKKELQTRLKAQEKKVDYFARAKQLEEIPLLIKQYEQQAVEDKQLWDEMEQQRIAELSTERTESLACKERLARMTEDKQKFAEMLEQTRYSIYEEKFALYQQLEKEERAKRLAERKARRKEERRQKWLKEKEEEIQRKKDEEAKRAREEEQLREEEEYHKKMEALKEQEAIRTKKREMEERDRERQEEQERLYQTSRSRTTQENWRQRREDSQRDVPAKERPSSDQGTWRTGGNVAPVQNDRLPESRPWRSSRETHDRSDVYRPPRRDVDDQSEPRGGPKAEEADELPADDIHDSCNEESSFQRDRRDNHRDIRLDDPDFRRRMGLQDERDGLPKRQDDMREEPSLGKEAQQEEPTIDEQSDQHRRPEQRDRLQENKRDVYHDEQRGREERGREERGREERGREERGREERGREERGREERGGFGSKEERGGFGGRTERGGFGGRDERGGFGGRDERGGRDDRRGFGRQEERSGFGREGGGSRRENRWGPDDRFRGERSWRDSRGPPREDRPPVQHGSNDDWQAGQNRRGQPSQESRSWRSEPDPGQSQQGEDKWRRGGGPPARQDGGPPMREMRRDPPPPLQRKQEPELPASKTAAPPQEAAADDDGWEKVVKRR